MLNLKKDDMLLSRFCLREMVGQGGMGQVWLVWDNELEVEIAVKILNPQLMSDPHRVELLKNECRNTRRLAHPNIVRVFDFHRSEDLAFISMEYVDGQNLNEYRRRHEQMRAPQVIRLINPVINALGYAHDSGLVHRDLKAGNILIDRRQTPKLTDFGIAGVFKSGHHALDITSGGSMFCMSPQQLRNQSPSPSDDIYALGVLLYQLFTGYPPFYPDITRDRIERERPIPVNRRLEEIMIDIVIPDEMENLISEMLAKSPADRPARMGEIEARFDRILSPPAARNSTPTPPAPDVITPRATSDHAEMISPVRVIPVKSHRRGAAESRSHLVKGAALLGVFVLLLSGGLWLWHYLAGQQNKPADPQEPPGTQSQPPAAKTDATPGDVQETTIDPARFAAEKKEAEEALAEFMQLKQTLQAKGVSKWGAEAYQEMSQLADEADRLLIKNQHAAAAQKYTAAVTRAQTLVDQAEPVLARLLKEGQAALESENGPLAEEKFSIALMIDPNNPVAQKNLQRARNLDAVAALLESGENHENGGNYDAARADYQKALGLDPDSQKARQALVRVESRIREQTYQALMSEGLTALHQKDYQLARTKLRQALTYRPKSQEARDALAQADQSIRLSRIETYRKQASASEQSENWQQALDAYQQVLKIDSNLEFAVQGQQRALKHIRIEKRLNFFLQQPSALESDQQLENALELKAEIEALKSTGPRLKTQYDKFADIVTAAQTPVRVIIESDTFTDVAVYKVGKLGRFASRELSLRPGAYTVVGTRDGYQDVRKKVVVKPTPEPVRVTVRCEVKI